MVANPYTSQIQQLPGMTAGARAALAQIYKDMQANNVAFGSRIGALDRSSAAGVRAQYGAASADIGKDKANAIASILGTANQSQGMVDPAEAAYLSSLATRQLGQYGDLNHAYGVANSSYGHKLGGVDSQYAKDLRSAVIREKQARLGELAGNALTYGTNLRTNAALFDAQAQQLNQNQALINQGMQAATSGGRGGGGAVPQANGKYKVGSVSGLSQAEAYIIQHESGGNPTADNPTSTAFGIWQGLDSTRRAYAARFGFDPNTTDVNQQLTMFRAYIRDRYGTAENAMRFWQAHHWY